MLLDFNLVLGDCELALSMDIVDTSSSDSALMSYLQGGNPAEPEVVEAMRRALHPADLAVDAGANNGFFSLLMSKLVGPAGKVLSFEPDARNLDRLKRNLDLNQAFNVEVIERPLWSKPEEISMYHYADDGANSHFGAGTAALMQATTLDLHTDGGQVPAFMKMDIEGAEYDALLGATYLMAHHCPMTVEMNQDALEKAGNGQDAVHHLMHVAGYSRFVLHPDGAHPTFIPKGTAIRSQFKNTNILYATFEQVAAMWPEVYL